MVPRRRTCAGQLSPKMAVTSLYDVTSPSVGVLTSGAERGVSSALLTRRLASPAPASTRRRPAKEPGLCYTPLPRLNVSKKWKVQQLVSCSLTSLISYYLVYDMLGHKYTNNTFIVMDTHQRIKKSFLKQSPAPPGRFQLSRPTCSEKLTDNCLGNIVADHPASSLAHILGIFSFICQNFKLNIYISHYNEL